MALNASGRKFRIRPVDVIAIDLLADRHALTKVGCEQVAVRSHLARGVQRDQSRDVGSHKFVKQEAEEAALARLTARGSP